MSGYWAEFSQVAMAHLLAVASPGPDFAVVLKQSLVHGRSTARWTAAGVGTAILLHVGYSLLGLGLVVRGSPEWFAVVKYAGAAYIGWLGVQALRARPRGRTNENEGTEWEKRSEGSNVTPTAGGAFATGFLTNALNPKATLFFVSLFVLVVNPVTPKTVQAAYGMWMAVATAAWFWLVATLFTRPEVRRKFLAHGHWIDRALGVLFLAFAASLVLAPVG